MTDAEKREAAHQFINRWMGRGNEDEDGRSYWLEFLSNVMGMENPTERVNFEKKVIVNGNTKRIDVYIPETHVIIEQKSLGKSLDQKIHNSGDVDLTPYEQAKRYNDNLPYDEKARWIITCNFSDIWIYDMNARVPEPVKIALVELQSKYLLLDFLVKQDVKKLSHEMEVSIKAGDIVGLIYDAFLKQYKIPDGNEKQESAEQKEKREHKLKSLNALCVRLVFCLYAEDAGIFGEHRDIFHDYLEAYDVKDCRRALIELFKTLDTPIAERDEYLEEDVAQFPYVNGGLFADETIEIPPFTEEIKDLLLTKASEDFDWSDISPTIFGAVFESTLNPETRRSGGMHYTSIENIHKVIDPLFLDDLKKEFKEIQAVTVRRTKEKRLDEFQNKLASLTFLDPACGSGNFLTETYLSLRRLENEVIRERVGGQITLGEVHNPIKVSIQQFYGIEINDFAVTVAKTALWIAESQMLEETKNIVYGFNDDFLPLKTYVNITEGNALRIDWNEVVPVERLPMIKKRVQQVREFRLKSTKAVTVKSADSPTLFQQIRQPDEPYIIVPRVSSENRRYIPMGYESPETIITDSVQCIPNADLYTFGIITSNVHMAWTRVVCGRLKSDYRYSAKIVYNNFPWPEPTEQQKQKIEETAHGILDARALFPDSSLADLYDPLTMPVELRKAHIANDKAVMAAYGFGIKMTEEECVAELMKLYQKMQG